MALLTLTGFNIGSIDFVDTTFNHNGRDFVVCPIRVHMNTGIVSSTGFGISIFLPYRENEEGANRQQWTIYSALDTILGNGATFRYSLDTLSDTTLPIKTRSHVYLGEFVSVIDLARSFLDLVGTYNSDDCTYADMLVAVDSDVEIQSEQDVLIVDAVERLRDASLLS